MGTFDYISPEQARDPHSVDVRSDIYSLGCTLYHMLTGEPPYPEGTALQKLLDHQDKDPPDPAKKNRRVTPMLSHVVRKMMASLPARRYASPGDLLRDLLIVARSLGAGAVPIDGQVWLTATRFKPPFWQNNFGWVATTCALCLLVAAVQFYPDFSRIVFPPNTVQNKRLPSEPFPLENVGPERTASVAEKQSKARETTSRPSDDPKVSVIPPDFLNQKALQGTSEKGAVSFVPIPPTNSSNLPEPVTTSDKPKSLLTADKIIVPPGESIPAIQIKNGKSYASLEAACTEAAEVGSTIELR